MLLWQAAAATVTSGPSQHEGRERKRERGEPEQSECALSRATQAMVAAPQCARNEYIYTRALAPSTKEPNRRDDGYESGPRPLASARSGRPRMALSSRKKQERASSGARCESERIGARSCVNVAASVASRRHWFGGSRTRWPPLPCRWGGAYHTRASPRRVCVFVACKRINNTGAQFLHTAFMQQPSSFNHQAKSNEKVSISSSRLFQSGWKSSLTTRFVFMLFEAHTLCDSVPLARPLVLARSFVRSRSISLAEVLSEFFSVRAATAR